MKRRQALFVGLVTAFLVPALVVVGCKKPSQQKIQKDSFGFFSKKGGTEEVMILKNIQFLEKDYSLKATTKKYSERAVLEFVGQKNHPSSGVPRYHTRLGKLPYSDSEGKNVSVKGQYYFELVYNGNIADLSLDSAPIIYKGPKEFQPGFAVIKEAKFVPAYENNTLILLIGLTSKAPFKMKELLGPPRIVVDFRKKR